jgi:hypothetical protein
VSRTHRVGTSAARSSYERDGFLVIRDFTNAAAIAEVEALLDPLFTRFAALDPKHALDLAPSVGGVPQIPDINRPLSLEPRLKRTTVFRDARELAREVLGIAAFHTFDHAIYKQPGSAIPTSWHQDHAYGGLRGPVGAIHIWIPLQDATAENGCMWYVPGSHRSGMIRHERMTGNTRTLIVPAQSSWDAVCCPVPKGGATAHGPLTLHMAGPNRSHELRKAWVLHFVRFGVLAYLHPASLWKRMVRRSARLTRG